MSLSFERHFWARCRRVPSGCMEWQGSTNGAKGYGKLKVDGRYLLAHRLAWELANGREIPEGMVIMHACDNPPCCNPAHLQLGTHALNLQDAERKGRHIGANKLTREQVREIRARLTGIRGERRIIAREFGVCVETIGYIARGASWANLEAAHV